MKKYFFMFSPILALMLGVLALFAVIDVPNHKARLKLDSSISHLLGETKNNSLIDQFPSQDPILFTVRAPKSCDLNILNQIKIFTQNLQKNPNIQNIHSIADLNLPLPDNADNPSVQCQAARQNILLQNNLVSRDGLLLGVVIEAVPTVRPDYDWSAFLGESAQKMGWKSEQIAMIGAPLMKSASLRAIYSDYLWLIPVLSLMMAGFLWWEFQSIRLTVLALSTMGLSVLSVLAIPSLLNLPLNAVTTITPPLILTISLAYCAHLLTEFQRLLRAEHTDSRALAVYETLRQTMFWPLAVTGFTSILGFLALLFSDLAAIRQFALLASAGVIFAFFYTLFFLIPSLWWCAQFKAWRAAKPRLGASDLGLFLGLWAIGHPRKVLYATAGVAVAALLACSQIHIGLKYVHDFTSDAKIRSDYLRLNQHFGGITPVNIIIHNNINKTNNFYNINIINNLNNLKINLINNKNNNIKNIQTWADILAQSQQYFLAESGQPLPKLVLPANAQQAEQLSGMIGRDLTQHFISLDAQTTKITLRLNTDDTKIIQENLALIHNITKQYFPKNQFNIEITGPAVLATEAVNKMTKGQIQGVLTSLAIIALVLMVLFTSIKTGLTVAIPLVLPVLAYYGALGLFDVTLNPTTSLIACIVLGVAVDDTLHYLVRYNHSVKKHANERAATHEALSEVIRPVTLTKVAIFVGFGALAFSSVPNQAQFGFLAAFTLFVAWWIDVLVMPALTTQARIVTLWDTLRLNLGGEVAPHKTIGLFEGLTLRQARIFALMSNLKTLPPNTALMREGDVQKEVYLTLEGELSVWLARDGQRVDLGKLQRGAVIGEAGYFGQVRTANVDTLSTVKVLSFRPKDLDRLRRRYPWIAALVYRNFSRILAERIANTTKRVH